ncbi:hypothetical protein MKEN_01170200 [Mycena kentingensis (nom. inval.)]|nr:hypothetical protein MKEN_01170200 [Mycena kentingensis (nom. inval.)]
MPKSAKVFNPRSFRCQFCERLFKNASGRTQHQNSEHPQTSFRHRAENVPADDNADIDSDDADDSSASESRHSSPTGFEPDGNAMRQDDTPPPPQGPRVEHHPHLTGRPCDREGNFLPAGAKPLPKEVPLPDDFSPYEDLSDFRLADFIYRRVQMSASEIDELMDILASRPEFGGVPPFRNYRDLYGTIDATERGHIPWQKFEVKYDGPLDAGEGAPWQHESYAVYFRCPRAVLQEQLRDTSFKNEFDVCPKRVYGANGRRRYRNFMSGDWAWRQAVCSAATLTKCSWLHLRFQTAIAQDPETHGATFVPLIEGSDKTTTSVGTGQHDFYPLYESNGLFHNEARRSHRNAVSVIAFLAIPKTDREHANSTAFRTFRRRLFHASLQRIFESLKPGMTKWEVMLFPDGHYRRVIFGLGPYIADYPEQVLLACVVQGWCARCRAKSNDLDGPGGRRFQRHTEALFEALDHKRMWDDYGVIPDVLPFTWDFPRADIHELLSPDLLHQVIKGTFKDHLVTWVEEYLVLQHGKREAAKKMADIDRRIAAVPAFPGIRRFPDGRGFEQWTGDDSKALMKVFLPAIEGHVPPQMVRALAAFLDFCYLVRRNDIGEDTLDAIEAALERYHVERQIFQDSGVCPDGFSLPRQHSISHYPYLIREFAAPNGLCSSITESKHIKAVKEPWRRSSRFEALSQMLTINNRLDNLAATRRDFMERGILQPIPVEGAAAAADDDDPDDDNPPVSEQREFDADVRLARNPIRGYPRDAEGLARLLSIPKLPSLIRRFLYAQENQPLDPELDLASIDVEACPFTPSKILCYPSAIATFYAPSDQCSTGGLLSERIRSVHSWRGGPARHDCVFVEEDSTLPGFRGLLAARVLVFLSFKHKGKVIPCAVVNWFSAVGEEPDADVGMWMVTPDLERQRHRRAVDIIHLDSIVRGAHLIPVYGDDLLPRRWKYTDTLDSFKAYYINKYADHHAHEIAF